MGDYFDKIRILKINSLIKQHNSLMRNLSNRASLVAANISKSKNINMYAKKSTIIAVQNHLNNQKNKHNFILSKKIQKLNHLCNINRNNHAAANNVVRTKKRAMVVGINYQNSPYQLQGCINDAKYMTEFILSQNYNTIVTLTDKTKQKPTRQNILKYFKMLLSNDKFGENTPNTYLFFCSAHGSIVPDKNGDETTGFDEAIVPIDVNNDGNNIITDDELRQIILSKLNQHDTLIGVFDSCDSATIFDTMYTYLDSTNNNNLSINPFNLSNCGQVITISGCTDLESSADTYINGEYCGAFTHAFLSVIKNNKNISWATLIHKMRDLLKQNGYSQVPQLSSYKYLDINSQICF
jgi:hypothetical protein